MKRFCLTLSVLAPTLHPYPWPRTTHYRRAHDGAAKSLSNRWCLTDSPRLSFPAKMLKLASHSYGEEERPRGGARLRIRSWARWQSQAEEGGDEGSVWLKAKDPRPRPCLVALFILQGQALEIESDRYVMQLLQTTRVKERKEEEKKLDDDGLENSPISPGTARHPHNLRVSWGVNMVSWNPAHCLDVVMSHIMVMQDASD